MKTAIYFFAIILLTTKSFANDINLHIRKEKKYYSEIIKSTKNPILIEIQSKDVQIENISICDNSEIFKIKNLRFKANNKKLMFVISKEKDKLKKKLTIEIRDFKGNTFFLTLLFYSEIYNIDEISEELNLNYDRSEDYPIALMSHSHVIGNYLIFSTSGERIYGFQLLNSFMTFIDALKEGEYFVCENNFNNKLFSLSIK
ncbi:hypothetical protein [Salinimicrobium gaetbulicola]|uniref:Uncharacterized protein n=1 Tax=Salinimicrobium gaetbulicola TaxID=999702 RepID=A0ABW3IBC4_9FLAO